MIFPWARVLISAGAHGLRRNPGQSVNLAHPFWRNPCAPAPLSGHPRRVFLGGAMGVGGKLLSPLGSTYRSTVGVSLGAKFRPHRMED